jgi:hypothetical protein
MKVIRAEPQEPIPQRLSRPVCVVDTLEIEPAEKARRLATLS